MIEDLSPIVLMHGEYLEREPALDALECFERRVLCAVPGRAQNRPLGLAVCAVEYPEEVVGLVASSECKRVELHIARGHLAGHD